MPTDLPPPKPPTTPATAWIQLGTLFVIMGFITLWVWMVTGGGGC